MSAAIEKIYVAIVGMPDCGKSTFIKNIVKQVTSRDVAVDSFCDEQAMDMTIRSAQLVLRDKSLGYDIVFLDCPGHIFEYEMEATSVLSKSAAIIHIKNARQNEVIPYNDQYASEDMWQEKLDAIGLASHKRDMDSGQWNIPYIYITSHCVNPNNWSCYDISDERSFKTIYTHITDVLTTCKRIDPWDTALRITKKAVEGIPGKKVAMCSFGKDSLVLLDLLMESGSFNSVAVEYPNSGYDLPGISSDFRSTIERRYGIEIRPFPVFEEGWSFENHSTHELMLCKARMLTKRLSECGYSTCFTGIRRDEEGTRAKEKFFSPRGADGSYDCYRPQEEYFGRELDGALDSGAEWSTIRVNPLLDLTENDIWRITRERNIPVCNEYFSVSGQRYRSLGDWPITTPIKSEARTLDQICEEVDVTLVPERACRSKQDNCIKHGMEKLRKAGFF